MDKIINFQDFEPGCTFTACASTEMELFEEVLEHGRTVHGMKEFSREFYDKVRSSLRDGYCDLEEELCKYSDCWLTSKSDENCPNQPQSRSVLRGDWCS